MIDAMTSRKLSTLSFVAACLIVFHHVPMFVPNGIVSSLVLKYFRFGACLMAVPFFFFAAGFLIMGKYQREGSRIKIVGAELRKRVRSLLIPFAIFNTIAFLLKHFSAKDWSGITAISLVREYGLTFFDYPIYHLLWYVLALYIIVGLSPVISFFIQKRGWVAVSCLGALWGMRVVADSMAVSEHLRYFFDFGLCLRGVFFFSAGMFVRECMPRHFGIKWIAIFAGLIGYGLVCFTSLIALESLGALLAIIGLWYGMDGICVPKELSRNAFSLYLLHGIVLYGLRVVYLRLWHCYLQPSVAFFFVIGLCTIVFCVVISEMMRKLIPRVSALFFGGR